MPDGGALTHKQVASIAYVEFSSGRIENAFDAEKR